MGLEPKLPEPTKKMGTETEMFKMSNPYRIIMSIGMVVVIGLGGWNLKATHDSAVLIEGLTQRVKDRDEEINRLAEAVRQLTSTVEAIKDHQSKTDTEIVDRASKLDTRISVLEEEIKKP